MLKKPLLVKLIIAVIFLVGTNNISYCVETNLLVNPDFEKGATGWILWGLELPLPVTEQPHTGKRCLRARDVAGGYTAGAWQWLKTEPGTNYIYEGWIKTDSLLKGEAWIELQWFDETNSVQIDETVTSMGTRRINDNMDWTKVEIEACAPPNAKIIRIAFKVEGTGGYAYFDDAKLIKRKQKIPL